MAQLLDGEAFVKWFKKEYELEKEEYGKLVEYDRWISSVDVIDDIESITPYTTEAEIRNRAIDEFAEAIKNAYASMKSVSDIERATANTIAMGIAEQLKGE